MMDVVIGRYYVDKLRLSARKVTHADERLIEFVSFHLDTGRSDGNIYQSLRTDFMRWVDTKQR